MDHDRYTAALLKAIEAAGLAMLVWLCVHRQQQPAWFRMMLTG